MNTKGQTGLIILGVFVAIILITVLWVIGAYNGLIRTQTETDRTWANVQSAYQSVYQRRADLIPNLVETVKGYKDFEQATLVQVTQMRAEATQAKIDVSQATNPADLQAAMDHMDGVLSRLLVVVEQYPNLKANENFLALQDELAGTENRVKVERDNFNTAVKAYNVQVRSFPSNLIATQFGFQIRPMFQANESSATAPVVKFS